MTDNDLLQRTKFRKKFFRCFPGTPLGLAVALAVSAYAQEQSSGDPGEQAGGAADSDQMMIEEITVIAGVRYSMTQSREVKRDSNVVVDAIVAEDIGKLPDVTAAESVARVPGVLVERSNDEVYRYFIRGLPDPTTTYNGREIFSAEMRRVQLQDFPSQELISIEVYKSTIADIIEPGIAGLVNVRTRRPFDFEGQEIAGGVYYSYNDQSEKAFPKGNILYTNRWDTNAGEIGFLANGSYAQHKYYNGIRYNSTGFLPAQSSWNIEEPYSEGGFVLPESVGLYNPSGERWRPSWNMALQWRPNEDLEIYFDGIFQGFRGTGKLDQFNFSMNGTDVTLADIVMVEGTDNRQVASVSKSGGSPPWAYRLTNKNRADLYQYAIGAKWDKEPVQIITDLAYTDSEYTDRAWSVDSGLAFSPSVESNFFGDYGVTFDTPDWDLTDIGTYEARGYYEALYKVAGSGWQWRTDLIFNTGWGEWLHTLKAGVRYSNREATRKTGSRYSGFWDLHIPLADLEYLDLAPAFNPFRSGKQGFARYLAPTLDSIQSHREDLVQLAYESALALGNVDTAAIWANPGIPIDEPGHWLAEEQSYALYLQTESYFMLDEVGVDVVAGIRVVQTDSENTGTSTIWFEGERTLEPRTEDNSYVDALPVLNIRAMLTDDWQLRATFTKTRTKPNFGDLNPALNITRVTGLDYDADGWSGNPDLGPLTAYNYDISLEYYFDQTGYVSAGVFYRDVRGFTNWYTRFVQDSVYGRIRLNRPENAGEGRINGWELSASTFLDFDFLPDFLHSLGFAGNFTRLEAESRFPDDEGNFGEYVDIPGLSRNNVNAAVFYEDAGFSARLSYNLRDTWVNWYGDTSDGQFAGNKTLDRDRLDFTASYDVTDNLSVTAEVTNILAKPFRNYTVTDGLLYPQDVRDEGRYFSTGFRFNF